MNDNDNKAWEQEIARKIAVDLKTRFGRSVSEAAPIDKGWLNVKWKMATDQGPAFVKHYHPDRYKLHASPERRSAIERSLQLQHRLSLAGIPCPKVSHDGASFMQQTPSGLFYAVHDWVEGQTAEAGHLNDAQMFALGEATGRMHRWLRAEAPTGQLSWRPDKAAYGREWQINWNKAEESADHTVMEWLRRSRATIESLDFARFEQCKAGWLHWDLWVDNIVLHARGVAGIVDFDRMAFAYPEIDIARAVLSGALRDGHMRLFEAQAFMDGYRGHAEAPRGILSRSLRLLYVIESGWWLRTEVRRDSELTGLLARFVEEMHWLEDHWDSLEELDAL
ncbi:phosphotransferase enzyme family protein [Paenibacillus sacheonensis]|uniref:Phosphotransferase n=1 Tax=Paenibacillus sacheonensis TaxID=742054 RepID=A0A7X5C150_9BACL|nr:phosphotransferase [Paenibacillus sacheonensis]MBM7568588.1 homoserine kinase type II [Paenibacillus sacheonensis]NBC72407.1 phosphotransferase [Paenibacillus sacheonensis]